MHDNKRVGKKITTWLWIMATTAPFIMLLIGVINAIMKGNQVIDETVLVHIMGINYELICERIVNSLIPLCIPNIASVFSSLFGTLGIVTGTNIVLFVVLAFTWAIQVQIFHIIYDVLTILFKLAHNFFGKLE